MRKTGLAGLAALAGIWTAPAAASEITAEAAIARFCEPLVSGSAAKQIEALAAKEGLRAETVSGQKVMRQGELLVGLSYSPRVCFVQAPSALTRAEGFALVDSWARRQAGAMRMAATAAPDGSPVRGWSAPARRIALIATEQSTPAGPKVMSFILMPLPAASAAR